jgi:hypothetical protein
MKFKFNGELMRDEHGRVYPSPEQLGITFDEMCLWSEQQTQLMYDKWNAKRIEHNTAQAKIKAEKNHVKIQEHWYNTVPKALIKEALIKAIPYYPQVMQSLIKRDTPKKILDYYTAGYKRVNEDNISLHPVSAKKLKEFPSFDEKEVKIVGSPRQAMRMYMELFPPLIRTKSRMSFD